MSRTAWTITAAVVLVLLAAASALTRRALLDDDFDGPRTSNAWKVTLVVTGKLQAGESTLRTPLPLDFRKQHILIEGNQSKELMPRPGRGKGAGDELVWQRAGVGGALPFRASVTCRCLLSMRRPTAQMERLTEVEDTPPQPGAFLQPTSRIERDDPEIHQLARRIAEETNSERPSDLVRAFFDHVRDLDNEPFLGDKSAVECLRDGSGDSGAKSRLLAALCRNRRIPARVLGGLILSSEKEPRLHHWVEACVDNAWLPACPIGKHYGPLNWPKNYLILQLDDEPLVRSREPVQFGFTVQDLRRTREEDLPATAGPKLWQRLSFHGLKPAEQHLVRFLLLLPLAALIVTVFRAVIGVPTFGTFSPALIGLAFLDLRALPVGLPVFVMLILVGWGMRHLLDRFHLLQVPRASAMLTLIVMLLLGLVAVSSQLGLGTTHYFSLFPLVILTHLVERFWTIEAEDGSVSSFRTLLGTLIVAVTVSVCLSPAFLSSFLFRYPETLCVVLALLLLLGRYTGYRLSELYRFGDLIRPAEVPHSVVVPVKQSEATAIRAREKVA